MFEAKIIKAIFIVVFVGLILWFIYAVFGILVPFIVSALFAYMLSPLIIRLQSLGLKRVVAVSVLYIGFLLIFAGTIAVLLPGIIKEVSVLTINVPKQIDNIQVVLGNLQTEIENKYPIIKEKQIIDTTLVKVKTFINEEVSQLPSLLMNIFSVFSIIILIPIVTFLLLLDGRKAIDALIDFLPARHTEAVLGFISDVDEIIGKYIKGQVIENSIVAVMAMAGLMIIGVDYAIILGILTGLANMVPYLGPVCGAVPAIFVAFVKFQSISSVIAVVIVFSLVQFIDNNFVQPIVIGKGVNLSTLTMMFSIMAGAQVFGFMGMLFAVPAACIIKNIFEIVLPKTRSWFS